VRKKLKRCWLVVLIAISVVVVAVNIRSGCL